MQQLLYAASFSAVSSRPRGVISWFKERKIAAAVLAVRHKDALGLNVLSTSCSRPEKRESDEEGAVVDDVLDFWAKLSSLPLPPPLPQEVGETVFASAQIRAARSIAPICHQPPPIL